MARRNSCSDSSLFHAHTRDAIAIALRASARDGASATARCAASSAFGVLDSGRAKPTAITARGFPCCVWSSVSACRRHYPGRTEGTDSLVTAPSTSAFPRLQLGRLLHYQFRGLLSVHSRYDLQTRQVALCDPLHRRLRRLCYLRRRSDCYRVERSSSRAGLIPAVDQRLFTAHCDRLCNANLLQSRCATPSSPREDREKNAIRSGYPRRVWGAALVHATSCTTASRFAGGSATRTPPITRNTI